MAVDKKAWKRQAKAAFFGSLASDLATGLIKAPFEEPRQRFLLHDQEGRELDRQHKGLSTIRARNAVTRKTFEESGEDGLTWFQNKNFDAGKARLADQYKGYQDDVFVQNGMAELKKETDELGQIEYDEFIASERQLASLPDRDTFLKRVDLYTPRSKSAPQALFRRMKRWINRQSYEDYVDNAVRNITDGTGIDFTDENVQEIKRLGLEARRPVNKRGVMDAIQKVLGIPEVALGMEQEKRAEREALVIVEDRLTLQEQYRKGNMESAISKIYAPLLAKSRADKKPLPTTVEVMVEMRKQHRASFIKDDSVTRSNMLNDINGLPNVVGYRETMRNGYSIFKTQDENEENGVVYSELDEAGQEEVRDGVDKILERVYSIARDKTLVQLERLYDEGRIPTAYIGTPAGTILQKQMIHENFEAVLLGNLEKGVTQEAVINKIPGWWDTTEAREYITGAIVGPSNLDYVEDLIQGIDPQSTDGYMPATGRTVDEDIELVSGGDLMREADTAAGQQTTPVLAAATVDDDLDIPDKAMATLVSDRGYHPDPEEAKRAKERSIVNGRAIIQNALRNENISDRDALWDRSMEHIKEFEGDDQLKFNPFEIEPSKQVGGRRVQSSLSPSPFTASNVDEPVPGDNEDEEFRIQIDSLTGKVTIDFQGTSRAKPSGWSLPDLKPTNNIDIDNIEDPYIYNALKFIAEAYKDASPRDKDDIIESVDFGYTPTGTKSRSIIGFSDTNLVKDLFSQFTGGAPTNSLLAKSN